MGLCFLDFDSLAYNDLIVILNLCFLNYLFFFEVKVVARSEFRDGECVLCCGS